MPCIRYRIKAELFKIIKMKKTLLTILTLLSLDSIAGYQIGSVDYVIVRASDGLTYFNLKTGTPVDKPECATHGYWMIKDENSEVGKKQYAMILAAHASGKPVKITGMNTCTHWGDGEDVNAIQILQQ